MSYRSKRTRAQMTEADMPANATDLPPNVTDLPPLTTSSGATGATDDRWGPFCPQKTKVPAVVKAPQQQPSLKDCRIDANIDEPYTANAPFSKTQVNPTFEKPPNDPSSRIQISHTFQEHAAKYPSPSSTRNPLLSKTQATLNSHDLATKKVLELSAKRLHASQKMGEPNPYSTKNPLLSKTHATVNSHDLAAKKALELPTKQLHASQKTGESNPCSTRNPLLSKTHATINSHDLAARKNLEVSAKQFQQFQASQKTGEPNPSSTRNSLLSKTHATVNSHDLAARKAQLSAQKHDASQKMGEQSQLRGQPSGLLCKNFTKRPDGSFSKNPLLSKTHATGNSYDLASAIHLETSQKTGEQAQVPVKPPSSLWKNSTTQPDRSFITNHLHSKTHATPNLHEPANRKIQELSTKQLDASQKFGERAQVGVKQSNVLWKNSPTNPSRVFTLKSTSSVKPAFSPSEPTSEIVGTTNNGSNTLEKSWVEPQEEEVLNQQDANQTSLKTFKPRRCRVVHDWPDSVEFDESEEVLLMDGEGNIKKVNNSIQPHDVWYTKNERYCVTFNEFYQPLKKGGHILVRFIGDLAQKENFCPIRDTNWCRVPAKFKVDIIKCIRDHFVIPDGDGYDKGILKRVGKSVRQYRHGLKKDCFKSSTKTKEEIYQAVPDGVARDSWIHLVDYWFSEKGKKLAECGKEARASQNHAHTTGSTSYANIRAEFEEKNKREPTELEVFKQTHKRKDGSYVKDTATEEFVLDADTYVESELAINPTKPKVQIQNEAFSKLMYGEDIPKRPLGYGFGVKGSDVFGVHGILRKETGEKGDSSSLDSSSLALQNMKNMEKVVLSLNKDKEELQSKLNETNIILYKILEGMSSGMSSPEIAQLKSTLNSQISDSTNGGGASR